MRKVAIQEGVEVMGSIKVLDLLFEKSLIGSSEYLHCLEEFKRHNGEKIRLPSLALQERIDRLQEKRS